jgi:hypothetical protein
MDVRCRDGTLRGQVNGCKGDSTGWECLSKFALAGPVRAQPHWVLGRKTACQDPGPFSATRAQRIAKCALRISAAIGSAMNSCRTDQQRWPAIRDARLTRIMKGPLQRSPASRRGTEVVVTGAPRKRLVRKGTWVRIPPSPPSFAKTLATLAAKDGFAAAGR